MSRHRTMVLAIIALGTIAGVVVSRFMRPTYQARAMLWLQGLDPETRQRTMAAGTLPSIDWMHLVGSYAVLEPVVNNLRLYLHPRTPRDSASLATFGVRTDVQPGAYRLTVSSDGRTYRLRGPDTAEQGRAGDSVGRGAGFAWQPAPGVLPAGRTIRFDVDAPVDAVRHLADALSVHADPGANLLQLELKMHSPALAAQALNAIAAQAVELASDLDRRKIQELAGILDGQYRRARDTLLAAEDAFRDFRTSSPGYMGPGAPVAGDDPAARPDPGVAHAFDLRVRLEQLRRDRRAIQQALSAAPGGGLQVDALSMVGAAQESPPLKRALDEATQREAELRALRYRYRDESAPIQEAQASLETLTHRSIPALARGLITELDAREAALTPQVSSATGYARSVPTLALRQARLQRDVTGASDRVTDLRHRYDDARLALVSSMPDLSIVDAAVAPHRPVAPLGPLVIALAFVSSVGISVLGVTLFDATDSRISHPAQIIGDMRLPILGALPHWRPTRSADAPDLEMVESLRALRLRVLTSRAAHTPLLLTVTSPASGDGKSFLAVNLALSFAYAGIRTLLIDGDVRGGAQHRVFHLPRRPGLTDVLAGQATIEEALRQTEHAGLTLLPSGRRMHRAPELLLSPELASLVARLRTTYDAIIIDSAPLVAGVDPLALAGVTGDLMLVMRAGATDLGLALSKIEAIEAMPIRTLGVVLNDVGEHDEFRYYTYDLSAYPDLHEPDPDRSRDGPLGVLGGRP